jgi:hypothetical protein
LFKGIAAETNRYGNEKINEAMPLEKYSILLGWEDITTEELVVFHDVLNLNIARCTKCSVKDFFSEQWLDSLQFYKNIVSSKRFLQLYWGLHISPSFRLEHQIAKCSLS